jgi:DNA segregation ATPase FtsK/SpoIIIE, S-DNA-T family
MTTPETPHQSGELVPKVYDAELVSGNDITSGDRSSGPVLRRVAVDCTGYVVQRVRESEQVTRLRSVAAYRARKAPHDLARLGWFLLRGHGRWIARGWTWATHGDLRADARAARLAGGTHRHAGKRRKPSAPRPGHAGPSSGSRRAA